MNDGGEESVRDHVQPNSKTNSQRKSGGDDFSRAIAKMAVAQVCESEGYQTFQLSALETLTDVAVRYIYNIGKNAHSYANLSGRTESNFVDIIQGLEDLGSVQGFPGASDIDHSPVCSGIVRDISHYISDAEQIPFAYTLPEFPVLRDRKLTPSFLQTGKETPEEHIPPWLPAFPEPHTYAQLSTGGERVTGPLVKTDREMRQQNVDRSLLNFQQRFNCNGLEGPSTGDLGNVDNSMQGEPNPFLVPPLKFGEKEVSSVTVPAKLLKYPTMKNPITESQVMENRVSVLETFAPAIEAMQGGSIDIEEGQNRVLLNRRPSVQFKVGMGKKSVSNVLDFRPHNKGSGKTLSWFAKDGDKDEKSRRAEKILNKSMDNPHELAQL